MDPIELNRGSVGEHWHWTINQQGLKGLLCKMEKKWELDGFHCQIFLLITYLYFFHVAEKRMMIVLCSQKLLCDDTYTGFDLQHCWDLGRTNSSTSARRGDGLGNIRIWATPPKRLVFWDGAPSPTSGIRAMSRT